MTEKKDSKKEPKNSVFGSIASSGGAMLKTVTAPLASLRSSSMDSKSTPKTSSGGGKDDDNLEGIETEQKLNPLTKLTQSGGKVLGTVTAPARALTKHVEKRKEAAGAQKRSTDVEKTEAAEPSDRPEGEATAHDEGAKEETLSGKDTKDENVLSLLSEGVKSVPAPIAKGVQVATKPIVKGAEVLTAPITKQIKRGFSGLTDKTDGEPEVEDDEDGAADGDLPKVPPDDTVKKMDVIIKKKIRGISVQDYYDVCWLEGNKTDADPFYGPWLIESDKHDVNVEDWTFAKDGEDFVGDWCGEKYNQKRTVTFRFTRTTALFTGPPEADVTQTHYCRVEGNDKCVVMMTFVMDGIPFGDCFHVEVRWVARRVGTKDLSIEVGLFVNFIKSTMVASKIRAGTSTETTKTQMDLFQHVKEACSKWTGEEIIEEDEEVYEEAEEGEVAGACSRLAKFCSDLFGGSLFSSKEPAVVPAPS